MRVLVTGAFGLLGREVGERLLALGHEVVATDIASEKDFLDITDRDSIRVALRSIRPGWVVNCAAYTNVDACEAHEPEAILLNATGPELLAVECKAQGSRLLHMSTDYVFDGAKTSPYTEDDPPCPLNAYGRSKLTGEQAVLKRMEDPLIVRSQWLFGIHGKNFVSTIIEIARGTPSIRVVDDQWGSPTYAKDLAKAVVALMEVDARGVYHVCNRGRATWYDLARKAISIMELDTEVVPVSTGEFPRPARRPPYSILSTKRFTATTGKLLPPWQISIKSYIQEYLQYERG